MQIFNQYLDRFPPPKQQEIRRLLQQYKSAITPQDQALAQRRLEPYSRQIMQMASVDRQIGNPYLSQTNLNIENKYPSGPPPALPDDPIEVMDLNRPFPDVSRMTPQFPAAFSDSPVPGTTEMMSARDSLNEDADRRAMAIIAEAKRKRDAAQPAAPRMMGPANPPRNTSPFNYNIPAAPKTPAPAQTQSAPAQGGGLLDVDMDFFDNPTRMGLLQAGLGLLSAPRYSTNPNDVTLSSALARGLGGFVQGYGGTKKRLSEAERQRIEDERDARKEEYDIMYLRALTTDAISRAQQTSATMTEKAEARRLAGQLKESQVSQILGKQPDLNQTQRVERRKQLMGMSPEMLQSEYHQFFPTAEMQETQNLREKLATYTGQPAETYVAYESKDLISAISKFEEPKKPETKPRGSQAERDEDILINATAEQANDPKVQMAFQRLFLEPSDETTQWNPQKQQTERFKTYPTIPSFYVEKFPVLAQQQEQLKNQSSVVPAKPNLTEQQQRARGNVLAGFEQEIISNNYDEPMDKLSYDEMMPFRRFQSDEYRMKIDAQDRWIENVLRAASGAAIAQSEYDSYRTQYFPTPGEGTDAKERKRQMRALKVQEAQLKIAEQARIQGALPQVSEDPDDILLQ